MKPSPRPTRADPRPLTPAEQMVCWHALRAAGAIPTPLPRVNRHLGPTRCVVPNLDCLPVTPSCDPHRFTDEASVGTGSTPVPNPPPEPDPDPTNLLDDRAEAVGAVVAAVGAFVLILLVASLPVAALLLRWLL